MQTVSKESTNAAPATGAVKATKAAPSMNLFAVATTAVMPYSDDGPSGCGLLLACVKTEKEAVQTAVKFLKTYTSEMMPLSVDSSGRDYDYHHKDRAEQLCENASKFTTFERLKEWYWDFKSTIGEYLDKEEEERYRGGSNVNSAMSLHIKDALTDSYIIQSD